MSIHDIDPIDSNTERVLTRNTVTGFEQGIAAVAGLLTCGPIGALASWGSIRGLQGKWTPWFILGIPSVVVINIFNIIILSMLGSISPEGTENQDQSRITNQYALMEYVGKDKEIGFKDTLISQ